MGNDNCCGCNDNSQEKEALLLKEQYNALKNNKNCNARRSDMEPKNDNLTTVFDGKCESILSCSSINRMVKYLNLYQEIHPKDSYNVFNKENIPHLNDDYNHILLDHLSDNKSLIITKNEYESIYNYVMDKVPKCQLEKCNKYTRNNRNRETEIMSLPDINNDDTIDCEVQYFVETMDTIHCFFMHTFDVGYRLQAHELQNVFDEQNANDEYYEDKSMSKLSNLLKSKREKLKSIRGAESIQKTKFVTNVHLNSASNSTKSDQTEENVYIDRVFKLVGEQEQKRFIDFIYSNEYDTESFKEDTINNDSSVESNVYQYIGDNKQFDDLKQFMMNQKEQKKEEIRTAHQYSFGFRYDYWDPKSSDSGKMIEWRDSKFVKAKYSNLYQELVNNKIFSIDFEEFNTTKKKAKEKLDSYYAKSLRCPGDGDADACGPYNEKEGDCITLEHIMSVLFYTDYSDLSYYFSSTFRSLNAAQTIDICAKRNSEYAHLSRLLAETVNVFGTILRDSKIKVYYHGISELMIFPSFLSFYNQPTSTTVHKEVAALFAKESGAILELKDYTSGTGFLMYFNCNWLSTYSHEDERLFMLPHWNCYPERKLMISSITSISPGKINNYRYFVHALTSLSYVIQTGLRKKMKNMFSDEYDEPDTNEYHHCTKKDLRIISKFIKHNDKSTEYENKFEKYPNQLFDSFTKNVKSVHITEHRFWKDLGFDLLKPLFFAQNLFVKISDIIDIFTNCEKITIEYTYFSQKWFVEFDDEVVWGDGPKPGSTKNKHLDSDYLEHLLSEFHLLNTKIKNKVQIVSLDGIEPNPEIAQSYESNFTEMKWTVNLEYEEQFDTPIYKFTRMNHDTTNGM